ncbi:hypothetical protein ESCOCK354M_09140 [Escherichia coli]|jgi:hypothetical protein|nr:hypothetical protein G966_03638 [Escherichia coli UMEA 3323-1]
MTNLTLDVNIIDFPSIPVAMLPHRCSPELLNYSVVDSICQCNTPFNYLFRCFELQCLSRSVV